VCCNYCGRCDHCWYAQLKELFCIPFYFSDVVWCLSSGETWRLHTLGKESRHHCSQLWHHCISWFLHHSISWCLRTGYSYPLYMACLHILNCIWTLDSAHHEQSCRTSVHTLDVWGQVMHPWAFSPVVPGSIGELESLSQGILLFIMIHYSKNLKRLQGLVTVKYLGSLQMKTRIFWIMNNKKNEYVHSVPKRFVCAELASWLVPQSYHCNWAWPVYRVNLLNSHRTTGDSNPESISESFFVEIIHYSKKIQTAPRLSDFQISRQPRNENENFFE